MQLVVFLVLTVKEYSKNKLIIIILLIVVYWLIIVIPFPKCDSWGKWGGTSQECTCIGLEKMAFGIYDVGWSQRVGVPINYQCHQRDFTTGEKQQVACK